MNRKPALLDAIRYIANLEQAFVAGVSEADRQAVGTPECWSAKDLIAHDAAWKNDMYRRLAGEELPPIDDIDAINAEQFAAYQDKPWEEIVNFTLFVQAILESTVEGLDPEELEGYKPLGWPEGTPVWRSIAGTTCIHPLVHLSENAVERDAPQHAVQLQKNAVPVLLEIDDSPQWCGNLIYNLACQYALAGDNQNAILQLGEALRLNPDLAEWSQQDSDLDSLRSHPAYQVLYTQ